MNKANECTCPSGDGSLVHPCPAHPAVDQADVAAKLTFINGRPAMCGCQVEYSDGGGEYSDVIYVTLCAKHSGSAILDLVATNRIALTPEYEGQWHADLYLDREIPLAKVEGATPAEAVLALMSAERIDPEQESVEQAGGDERAVDGKPRATKCPDCGEGDLMPGDLCACGYETDPAAGYACSECDGSGDGYVGEVCRECDGSGWFVTPEQARAALAQPSPTLPPFAEKVLAKLRRFNECAEDSDSGGVDIGRHWLDLLTQLGLLNRVQRSPALWEISQQGEDLLGLDVPEIEVPDSMIEKAWQRFERTLQQLETPGQAEQAEQAEVERPEVVARVVHSNPIVLGQCGPLNANDELMTVAQHAASVARWAEMFNRVEQQRDAALARVAELEACGAPALLAAADYFAERAKGPSPGWVTLSAVAKELRVRADKAPVAQAQQLHDLDKQCRDDVARALGLRPNQERGFAWSYLLASIKSCVKASEDSAQAQHSVPETTNEEANSFLRVADAGQFKDNAVAVRTAAVIIRSLLHRPALMQSIIRHRIGLTPEYEGQWHADLYGEDGEVQHHAEADTPDEAVRAVVALAAAPSQAQHSVPEGWVQSLPLKDHQPCKPNEDRANGYTIPIYSRPVLVEEALRKLRAVLCDPIGNVVIDGSDGDREEVQRALGMLAAAPGKEGNDD
ncbi:hypothetical protein [Pseudomonas aeruginosa]|uniref:hypothetical protein n=1 Tax=Pseudomonas aeruginosa TaxID=287 RepID=UPI00273A48BA|nr:hypothetical protein [Pseudomonas aeruginosa]